MDNDLKKAVDFIIEIDKIKHISRKTKLFKHNRHENDAEHSWHLAMMVIVLKDFANEPIDILKVIKMALIHDIVEIDAGDVIIYQVDKEEKLRKESMAADRIFGILPDKTGVELKELWREFEERKTPEAKFAAAIDRLEPIMQNYINNGGTWVEFGIKKEMVCQLNQHVSEGSTTLWEYAVSIINHHFDK